MDSLFYSLGFFPRAPIEDLRRIFHNIIVPVVERGRYNKDAASFALFLETAAYEILVKATETEEEFKSTYEPMVGPLSKIGETFGAPLGLTHIPSAVPVVAFWLPGAAILAHTQQLLTLLRALKALPHPPISPIVYIGSPTAPASQKVFEATGWPVAFLGDGARQGQVLPPMVLLDRLRDRVVQDNATALVFVSTPIHMLTAVAMGFAPVTAWWSMKWHSLEVPGLDLRMTPRRGDEVTMGGYTWKCGHVCLPRLANPDQKRVRERLRKQYKIEESAILFGFLGREDKLSPEYGDAIATLLEAHQNAYFVFTGRQRTQAFEERLKSVANRVRFIGWVDVESVIWVLDVYADSMPMGSGHTAFAAMQAGIPVVTLMTKENTENSAASHISQIMTGNGVSRDEADAAWDMLRNEDLDAYPGVPTIQEYHYRLCQLAASAQMRGQVGELQRQFVEKFMMDGEKYATQTSRVILDAIKGKGYIVADETASQTQAGAESPRADGALGGSADEGLRGGSAEGSAEKPRGSGRARKRQVAGD